MKKAALLILVALLALSIAACAQKDMVIGTVGDAELMFSDYNDLYNAYYKRLQTQYDMSLEQNQQTLQQYVLDLMVRAEVIYQQALAQGYALTDEETQNAQQDAQAQYDAIYASYRSAAQQEGAADIETRAKQLFTASLKESGQTEETFLQKLIADVQKSAIVQKLEAAISSEITFTEQDAQARFTQDVTADRELFTNSPNLFVDAQSAYDAQGGIPPLFIPKEYIRVKHILISTDAAAQNGDADAKATADGLIARINAGEDFDALMAEYGTDPGMQAEPNKSLGYLMNEDTSFVPEFKAAALELQAIGDITQPVKTDYGYHIIKLVDRLPGGERAFEDVRDAYITGTLEQLQAQHFNEKVTAWMEATDITRDADKIRTYLDNKK